MIAKPYALISVTDKTGVVDFASQLYSLGFNILSTGGTAKVLTDAGVPVVKVSEFTDSPEIFDGRVKTLHPKIHGGILMDRENTSHSSEAKELGIQPIQLVVVNLYQFGKQTQNQSLDLSKAIEYIDIGGPTMLRGAAKNYKNCTPVIDPTDYPVVIEQLRSSQGLHEDTKVSLAAKVFQTISQYDHDIAAYFMKNTTQDRSDDSSSLPEEIPLNLHRKHTLRYGENPHQHAALYTTNEDVGGLPNAQILNGKALSYNNYLDLDAAINLVGDLSDYRTLAIIKHTNPCGVAAGTEGEPLADIYKRALACDPKSAFGGIIATNETIDLDTATEIAKHFIECIAAPGISPEALNLLSKKKNLRIVIVDSQRTHAAPNFDMRSIRGGLLLQQTDSLSAASPSNWTCPTKTKTSEGQNADLGFAWRICKHVKSNAIVYAKDLQTIAIGAGQVSRIDAAIYSAEKALLDNKSLKDCVMASDAFFPFRDCVDIAAKHGISAIIQPGGSMRDDESIAACDENAIAMAFTGNRHFRH